MKQNVLAMTTVAIWATMATVVKLLLSDIPDLQALAVSSVFAFLFLFLVNLFTGRLKKVRAYSGRDFARMGALGLLGLFLYSALYYDGIGQLTSQEACILNYLWPILLLIFSTVILKEKITVRKFAAMLLSFAGVVVLTAGSAGAGAAGDRIRGIVACISGAACYALYSVLNKKADYDQNIAQMIVWIVTAVCSFAAGMLTEPWVTVRGIQWLGILWLGIVIDAVAYLTWALALNRAENSANIANLAYLTPFLSVILSAVVLKEEIRLSAVIALVLIVGGILVQSGGGCAHSR